MVQEEIIARLAALTGQTQAEVVNLLSEASAEAVEDDVEYYTRADVYEPSKVNTEALYAQLNAGLLATQQAFKNITRTTANSGGIQFIEALDRAWTQINTGGFDYTTAIRNAITDLAEQGLNATNSRKELVKGAIRYNKTGHVDTLEVAVRRAVVTGANQTAMKTREVLADELDVNLVEVTAHGGARPEHAKWQGKIFSRNGKVTIDGVTYEDLRDATGYGTGAERAKLKKVQKSYTDFTEQTGMRKQSARTQIATAKAEREVRKANKTANVKTATKKDIEAQREQQNNVLTNNANSSRITSNNVEVRKQYIDEAAKITDNIDKTLPVEEQAKQAYEARNAIRTAARDNMTDAELRKELDRTRPNKTFEELIRHKMESKGMTRAEALRDIIKTATKTNADINKELGLDE